MLFTNVGATNDTEHEMPKLQVTLSAGSASAHRADHAVPHHPIICASKLRYYEDGSFACAHATIPPGDLRTKLCIDHSIALLLVELSHEL